MLAFIADDHSIIRSGLKHLLSGLAADVSFEEFTTYPTLGDRIGRAPRPDLVIADLYMPGIRGIDDVRAIVAAVAPVPVVVFSRSEAPEDVRATLSAGVRGFVPKSTEDDVVLGVVRFILSGGTYVPPALAAGEIRGPEPIADLGREDRRPAFDPEGSRARERPGNAAALTGLSNRQKHVLQLMAEGLSNQDIADRLTLTLSTVKGHVSEILKILAVENRTQAVLIFRDGR